MRNLKSASVSSKSSIREKVSCDRVSDLKAINLFIDADAKPSSQNNRCPLCHKDVPVGMAAWRYHLINNCPENPRRESLGEKSQGTIGGGGAAEEKQAAAATSNIHQGKSRRVFDIDSTPSKQDQHAVPNKAAKPHHARTNK